eukprot:6764896-Pyramimonas_sp.AAC.1
MGQGLWAAPWGPRCPLRQGALACLEVAVQGGREARELGVVGQLEERGIDVEEALPLHSSGVKPSCRPAISSAR